MEYKTIEEIMGELDEIFPGYFDADQYLHELVDYIKQNYKLIKKDNKHECTEKSNTIR